MARSSSVPSKPKGKPASPSLITELQDKGLAAPMPLPREFRTLDIGDVDFPSENTRPDIKPDDVAELAKSLQAQGLLHPIVVAPNGDRFTILAGSRRYAAAALLGWQTIAACVLEGGDARALEIVVTENAQRVDSDPMLEAEVVAKLLERPGWHYREVAAALGRTEGWVARRAALRNLTDAARKVLKSQTQYDAGGEWPMAWLEEVALLSPTGQLAVIQMHRPWNLKELRHRVHRQMGSLGAASWALEDATLDTIAGPCSTCRKHTAAVPSLFPEDKSIQVLKRALCLDQVCFGNKRARHLEITIVAAAEKSSETVVITEAHKDDKDEVAIAGRIKDAAHGAGVKTALPSEMVAAKKGDKGAVPVVYASGTRTGEKGWAKPMKLRSDGTRAAAPREPIHTMTMAEKRRALELRRARVVIVGLRTEIEELEKEPSAYGAHGSSLTPQGLLALVAAFDCRNQDHDDATGLRKVATGKPAAIVARVFEGVVMSVLNDGAFNRFCERGDVAAHTLPLVKLWLELLPFGATYSNRVAQAEKDLPEPASWKAEKAAAKSKPAKSAKRKARK